jgi:hypothetical protein
MGMNGETNMAMVGQGSIAGGMRDVNPTLEENINNKIDWHTKEIDRLNTLKKTLGDTLMNVNLRDLREAMNY